jgi:hypothetical protein
MASFQAYHLITYEEKYYKQSRYELGCTGTVVNNMQNLDVP